jgi:hypothetical protein
MRLRKLYDEDPHNLYPSSNVIRLIKSKIKIGEAHGTHGGEEKLIRILVGNPQGKRSFRRPKDFILLFIHKEKSNKMQQCIKILLFHTYMKLNMFRATQCPSSGA